MSAPFQQRADDYLQRIESVLDGYLPSSALPPQNLHEAMRYASLGGGKRIRPLLVYATGEALGIPARTLDPAAAAIEFMHAFSLVHDDLPAMDDDDLRRGQPSLHRAFDEATAILAADALQPLAFEILAENPALAEDPSAKVRMIATLAQACGANGMTGGQALDMLAERRRPDIAELEHMFRLKTGRLLRACVMMPVDCLSGDATPIRHALEEFIDRVGLAFQIRDDILDIEGTTETIGKPQGSDIARNKATYPALMGLEGARRRADELLDGGLAALQQFGEEADGLRWLARFIVLRTA